MQKREWINISLMVLLSIMLAGCFQGEQSLEEIDPPEDAEVVDNLEDITNEDVDEVEGDLETKEEEPAETVARQLYLLDANGMVVAQTLELPQPDSKEVATQALEYLVKGGPVTQLLPNGFEAVLPEGTEILGLNLQEDGTVIVDVSSEFEDYESDEEVKILEAMTYTLTQFDSIDRVQLRINGYPQSEMPVDGTPIGEGYSRTKGINVIATDTIDLIDSEVVTMFYPAEYNDNRYYIPVTQHIKAVDDNKYGSIVQALIEGPGYNNLNITHVFNTHTMLKENPRLKDGILELEFSKDILQDEDQGVISDEVMETLVRTLTEQQAVEAVHVKVEDVETIMNENGEAYNEPVTREVFIPTEKL